MPRGRNLIKRFFNKLKQFGRVATRYDKRLANFLGFVKLAAIAIYLKSFIRHLASAIVELKTALRTIAIRRTAFAPRRRRQN